MKGRLQYAWAVEFTGSPLDRHRTFLRGTAHGPVRTLLFRTRGEAREWLREAKERNTWAFNGGWACMRTGNRIYKDARVVRVKVFVEPDEPKSARGVA